MSVATLGVGGLEVMIRGTFGKCTCWDLVVCCLITCDNLDVISDVPCSARLGYVVRGKHSVKLTLNLGEK